MSEKKTVLITGASRGIGRAMAEKLIELGHIVIGCGRSKAQIDVLNKNYGKPHRFDVVDVSSDEQVKKWAENVLKTHEAPDLLLNNAALINQNAVLWKVPAEEFSQVIDVNIKGVANVIRHFVPAMVERRHGVIVNFSSGWGRSTSPEVAPYCTTKWAIEGLSKSLSQELPNGMCATAFSPGVIDTDMLRSCFGGGAGSYPKPSVWAEKVVPFLLKLGPQHNGKPTTAPA
jgi:NAD(P)-dependent dehydrogenase (short-subunit alcohol dehydrogenase family)